MQSTAEFKEVKKSLPGIAPANTWFNLQHTLATLQDKTLTTLDLSGCQIEDSKKESALARMLHGHIHSVNTLALLPDGRLISGSLDKTIKLWDLKSQTCVATLTGHGKSVEALALLPDGRLVSGSKDNTIKLWDLKSQVCVATLSGHSDGVTALVPLPDGRLISSSLDNTIKLWNLQKTSFFQKPCIATLSGHSNGVTALVLLPDGRLMSGSYDKTIKLWDLKSQTCVATLTGHSHYVGAFALLPDGRLISGSRDSTIKLWDLKTRTCVATLTGHSVDVSALALLPDGRLISGSEDKTIKVWDLKSQTCVATLTGHSGQVHTLALLSDGRLMSGSGCNTIMLWDLGSRLLALNDILPLLTALKTNRTVQSLNLSHTELDDQAIPALLALFASNQTITQLNLRATRMTAEGIEALCKGLSDHPVVKGLQHETLSALSKVENKQKVITPLVSLPAVTVGKGDAKSIGTPQPLAGEQSVSSTMTEVKEIKKLLPERGPAASLLNLQQTLATLQDKTLTTLDLSGCKIADSKKEPALATTLCGHDNAVSALALLPDGCLMSGSADNTIKLWDLKRQTCVATLSGHTRGVYALALLPDGRVISGSADNTIKLWDLKRQTCIATLSGHSGVVTALALLSDGRLISGSYDKTIKVWDLKRQTCVATLTDHSHYVTALALLPDGRLISGSYDETIKLWDLKRQTCVATLTGHSGFVTALALLPDGHLISGSYDKTINLWDLNSQILIATLTGHSKAVTSLALLPDGRMISGSNDTTIKLWSLKSQSCVATLTGHSNIVTSLALLPDGRMISGSFDNTLKLWELGSRYLTLSDVVPLLTALKTNLTIQSLNLSHTDLDDSAILALLELFTSNHALTQLDLRATRITARGVETLSKALADHPVLQGLQHESLSALPKGESQQKPLAPLVSLPAIAVDKRDAKSMQTHQPLAGSQPVPGTIGEVKEIKADTSATTGEVKETKAATSGLITALRISWHELKLGLLIGNGSYGDVYQGRWQGTEVAIKLLQLKTLSGPIAQEFEHEADIMMQCQFPNTVRLYGVCIEAGHYALIMEYMTQSLRHRLQDEKLLPWSLRWQMAVDITQGLAQLHARKILHRDLKSLNILLDKHQTAKIADFGLAKVKQEVSSSTTKSSKTVGSVRWRAPELFKRHAITTPAADIYSLGMILWELATRQLPFSDAGDEVTVMGWIQGGEQEKIPDDCPKALADLIRACWAAPDKRPSAAEVLAQLKQAQAETEQADKEAEDKSTAASEKIWHFDPATKPATKDVKDYVLIDASAKDLKKVCEFYLHGAVPGYDVKSIRVIYNPDLNQTFARTLPLIQHRHGQAAFAPKWSQETNKEWRSEVHSSLEQMAASYRDSDYPNVKLLPVWHGTKAAILLSLFKTGFAALASTDEGYFGKGLYSSWEPQYAYETYCQGALLVNWVAFYSAYPVIDGDMDKLMGKPAYQNYDAHFVPVVPQFPDPDCASFIPCKPKQKHRYQEIVVFDSARCLPRYLVELQPSFPKTITTKVESKGDGKAEPKGEALSKPKAPAYSQAASLAVFGMKALHQSGAGSSAGAAADALDDGLMASLPLG